MNIFYGVPMKILSAEFVLSADGLSRCPKEGLPEVAFAGRSNVGKSSLINVLINRKRLARTSNTPGRTQLINFYRINDAIFFVDLPGYGYAKVPLPVKKKWGPLVESYLGGSNHLRGVVVILDIRREPAEEDLMLMEWLSARSIAWCGVLTKADKVSRSAALARERHIKNSLHIPEGRLVVFSAKTGQGKDALWRFIVEVRGS